MKKLSLDPALEKYYAEGNEQERLATTPGSILEQQEESF